MERKKHKNESTGNYYTQRDFLIGKTIYLNKFRFQIQAMDEYSEKYMEDNPEIFPQSSLTYIVNKIREGSAGFSSPNDFAVNLIRTLDTAGEGFVSLDRFKAGLAEIGVYLTDMEEHTVIRKFDPHRSGKINMEEFYNAL